MGYEHGAANTYEYIRIKYFIGQYLITQSR